MAVLASRSSAATVKAVGMAMAMGGAIAAAAWPAAAEEASPPGAASDLTSLSLERLMEIEVTSVSKRPERLSEAAAAIFVLTQDDIRRSGMTSVPEVLRLVPGLDVAQSDANHWAVSSRGSNDVYSSKLLVLVDGRSIYTPMFAGVFWDVVDVPLEDIERIEVIRGPGGALWGANAVNGVINIITKPAASTQGLMVSASSGTRAPGDLTVRYGGRLSDTASYRVFVTAKAQDGLETASGAAAGDPSSQAHAGFRIDWSPSPADSVGLDGEVYTQRTRGLLTLPGASVAQPVVEHDGGGHALVNWRHTISSDSDVSLQAYFDRTQFEEYTGAMQIRTYDIEFKYHTVLRGRHDVVWGGGYRDIAYTSASSPITSLSPSSGRFRVGNLFGQDEMTLSPSVRLVAGVKLEANSYTGLEYEPTARLIWTPSPTRTVWAAVSRAVRVPSIGESTLRLEAGFAPGPPPLPIVVTANPDLVSETEVAFEAGYRSVLAPGLTLDIAAFYNRYADLVAGTLEPGLELTPPPPHPILAEHLGNVLDGRAYGGEISARWQATARWRLGASYDLLVSTARAATPEVLFTGGNAPGNNPRNQWRLSSNLDLPRGFEFDVSAQYVDRLPTAAVAAYTRVDMRLGWRVTDRLEFGLVGQNLLDDRHEEYSPIFLRARSEVPRTVHVYLRATY